MVIREELKANPRGNALHNLGFDAGFMALIATDSPRPVVEVKATKKKSFRDWWRGVFGQK